MSSTRNIGKPTVVKFNLAGREIFIETQKELLGNKNSYWMAALTKLKEKSAFKIYAKSQMIDFTTTNAITAALEQYEKVVKNLSDDDQLIDEEDGHEIDVYDYIPKEYHEIYNYSKKYQGIIDAVSPHPCAFLVTNDSITRSFGLMRVKDEIVCMVEGSVADSWKYVKNDMLSVSVWSIIGNIFKRINKPIMSVNELLETVKDDEKVWEIYEKGITMCINQVEQPASKQAVMKYKPTNISELTAFTSAVRPGFKSMFSKFLSRETFDYGIKLVDDLIQTPEMPYSYILYQETVMKLLVFAGFEEAETMLIIKAISKKVKEKIMKAQSRFIAGLSKRLEQTGESKESSKDKAEKMWQIIEDSSRYSSLGRLS